MKIYLDCCCFNRPFDDQSHIRVLLESEAKLNIQINIRSGLYQLVWSYIMDYENSKNPFRERRNQILTWKKYSVVDVEAHDKLVEIASSIMSYGVKNMDALHIACAASAKADYFITTDDGILKKATLINTIRITDPIGFIKEASQ